MFNILCRRLEEIEALFNVRIIYAAEAGSRAWGFASQNSDYDVRFIYLRDPMEYLRLEKTRDVIETPVDSVFDVNGWDLSKALTLLRESNPNLFEWFDSPIVYRESSESNYLRSRLPAFFSKKKSLFHYVSMAQNSAKSLREERVKGKMYLYALRSLLACRWIIERNSPPPVPFNNLVETCLVPSFRNDVDRLLELKACVGDAQHVPRFPNLDAFIEQSVDEFKSVAESCSEALKPDWEALNQIFFKLLNVRLERQEVAEDQQQ